MAKVRDFACTRWPNCGRRTLDHEGDVPPVCSGFGWSHGAMRPIASKHRLDCPLRKPRK